MHMLNFKPFVNYPARYNIPSHVCAGGVTPNFLHAGSTMSPLGDTLRQGLYSHLATLPNRIGITTERFK